LKWRGANVFDGQRSLPNLFAMEPNHIPPPFPPPPPPPEPSSGNWFKKYLGPVGVALVVGFKFLAKLKFVLLPLLKTGGTMILSIGAYAMMWGWKYAVGFVLLIFVHECGHLIAARQCGLKVGWPVFIPFMGALIALKEAPRNAWVEAEVGIGGPLLGTLGALACAALWLATGEPLFRALAYTGFFLNLFNLAPIGFLDGGRIVSALSPWLWIVGFVIMIALLFVQFNFIVLLILVMSLPRLFFLFRPKTEAELRYFELSPVQRLKMAGMYFGLIGFLVLGMKLTFIPHDGM
jgi:Zn-dependent protease